MDLTLLRTKTSKSLTRRWAKPLEDAQPVTAHLGRTGEFVPSDLRITCSDHGEEQRVRAFAWAADQEDHPFAQWPTPSGRYPHGPLPGWIGELADRVGEDLASDRLGTDPQAADSWHHGLFGQWSVDGADPVHDKHRDVSFVPADLRTACWAGQGVSHHLVALTAADRSGRRQWAGTRADLADGSPAVADMPDAVRALLAAQYEQVAALAEEAAAVRGA